MMSSSTGGTALASGQGANTIHSLAGLGRGYGSGEALYEAMPAAARKRWRDVQYCPPTQRPAWLPQVQIKYMHPQQTTGELLKLSHLQARVPAAAAVVYPVDEQALQQLTKSNPEEDPCMDSCDAITLDDLLKENGIKGGCLRMYKEKCRQPNFKVWSVPTQQRRDSDPEHCPELFYGSKDVWTGSPHMNGFLLFNKHTPSMKHRPAAPSKSLSLKSRKQQCSVHLPPQLLLGPRKLQVDMKMDPMPDPEAESSRCVAVCRLPRNQCIEYAYDTGSSQEGAAGNLQVTADEAHVAAVQSDVSLQTDRNTQKAVLFKCCTALDVVAVELTQLQHLNKFTLTERPHQRGSISIPKKCGCACYLKVRYPPGSFPDLCPVSRKPFTPDTAVHKAVIQQQHCHPAEGQDAAHASDGTPLISSQQEATAETSSQSGAAADQVQIWGQVQHTGHTPGNVWSQKRTCQLTRRGGHAGTQATPGHDMPWPQEVQGLPS
ncbi:hypothetical protein WJX79_008371 [Trebouxia sp. C0005]